MVTLSFHSLGGMIWDRCCDSICWFNASVLIGSTPLTASSSVRNFGTFRSENIVINGNFFLFITYSGYKYELSSAPWIKRKDHPLGGWLGEVGLRVIDYSMRKTSKFPFELRTHLKSLIEIFWIFLFFRMLMKQARSCLACVRSGWTTPKNMVPAPTKVPANTNKLIKGFFGAEG